ncbi:RimJ/RimL family protein N-acetyltransferase [Pseudomonas duriflava]|uniref:RimJ/RimL family protein N-acetyltransferase n=1 Tax=Pseudomonas duriflava TaxID=459528 RepID=A0A562QN38_9PSED|nr:GNAT family protein [Pseudomonas duriflava]TWI57476.1 RimJ/RimL family protein N-acetyltransferase [Pseudomonas duriflava]
MNDPLLLDIPEQLETERLRLRVPHAGDGLQIYEAIVESLEALRRFPASLPWALAEPSVNSSERFSRHAHSSFVARIFLTYLILDKKLGTLIGCASLHDIDWRVPKLEMGYWCRTSRQGQGYVTEAVNALAELALGHLKAQRLEIRTDDENTASCQVCERAGFTYEGTLRYERRTLNGLLCSTRIYARWPDC